MAEDFRMDSHKLVFHPERVSSWLRGENIYPVCIEISPSGSCNHRCIFCGLNYLGYKPALMDKDLIVNNLKEMGAKGLKSVVVCGEGEPLVNIHTPEIINLTKSFGLDIAMSSNGVLFTPETAKECLKSLTWIRFSVNAGSEETHRMVHQGKPGDFKKALDNIAAAVEEKKRTGLRTTIGVQMLLIPQNVTEILNFAGELKKIGVDYFTVKPFSKHPKSTCDIGREFDYKDFLDIELSLNKLSTENYQVIFRSDSMRRKNLEKCYDICRGIPFWAYIDANMEVWSCIAYIGEEGFSYGNLKDSSMVQIWESEKKKEVISRIEGMDIKNCRELCRLDAINSYLHQLKNPGSHVNFI